MDGKLMEPGLYTQDFEMVDVFDSYKSLIWTERYNKVGDFEYVGSVIQSLLPKIQTGRYLQLDDSDTAMIIETIQIDTDATEGDTLTVSGRSIESILDRRIVWNQTDLNSKLETAVERLLNENVINPVDGARKIPGFVYIPSGDPRINDIVVDKQFTGDSLLEAIQALCVPNYVGWKIGFYPDDENARFRFQLYLGEDRSYDQDTNPWVVFSPGFDNLVSTNYTNSNKLKKNVAHIKGEGEGIDRKTSTVIISDGPASPTGLDRKELYVDARDISQDSGERDEEGETILIPDNEYFEKLRERGREKLAECEEEKTFEGQADVVDGVYIYGKDFFMGDVVQLENEFDMTDKVRITEMIRSCDTTGFTTYPTFTSTSIKEEVDSSV